MKQKSFWTTAAVVTVAVFALHSEAATAQNHDFGIWTSVGVEKKFNKKWSLTGEGEHRTRNNSATIDRWSIGLDAAYRPTRWLKLDAGYGLLYDNNIEKITYNPDGNFNNWRPSYWGLRHRASFSATASIDVAQFTFSIRERWQYTHRPEKTTTRYDFDNAQWEPTTVRSKSKSVLRSRLQVEYNIPKCKIDPYASVEIYNDLSLQKTRFTVGADWKIKKRHVVGLYYSYQDVKSDDIDNEPSLHILGVNYKLKL